MSRFVYVVTLAEGLDRDPVMKRLNENGVPARGYFSPLHLQPYVQRRIRTEPGELPVTESIAQRTIALPFHNKLTEEDIDRVVDELTRSVETTA